MAKIFSSRVELNFEIRHYVFPYCAWAQGNLVSMWIVSIRIDLCN
jgi:hypothetical protein